MGSHVSRIAGVALLFCAGIASAATPLFIPLDKSSIVRKSDATDIPVAFNRPGLENLVPGDEVELTLPNGSRHDYVYEHSIAHGGGIVTWIARSPITGDNERAIITYGPHGAWGWMNTTYGAYRVYPSGEGYDLLAPRLRQDFSPTFPGGDAITVEPDAPGIEHLKGIPTHVPAPISKAGGFFKVTPVPTVRADVMIIYTKDLAQKLGVGLMPMLMNLIATANQAYVDSEVAITLRLVNATMLDLANTNGSSAILSGMRNAASGADVGLNAIFQPLTWGAGTSIRDQVGADFVALVRDGPNDTGGIGNLAFNTAIYPAVQSIFTTAYSVNNFCVQGCEQIFAHELGHNMGNHHDTATIAKDGGGTTTIATGAFPHSYGWYSCVNGLTCNPYLPNGTGGACTASGPYASCLTPAANDFGTVMSYIGPRIMKFSNPNLNNCVPTGGNAGAPRACGGVVPAPAPGGKTANNALSMNDSRGSIAAYRNETIANTPGSLQFTNMVFSGNEGGNITFTVSRVGGSSGAISVSYALTAGSAISGTDYTNVSGSLNWANGDTANKTFMVPISADALAEDIESFTATLSTPTGVPGVYIGYPATATGLINSPWPIGGTMPTGFTTSGPNAWTTATDQVFEGTTSLRSAQAFGNFGAGNAGISDLVYTANFSAGPVVFSYRVSSYQNQGVFQFLVDGVIVHTNTGESGWTSFAYDLTAGSHTLTWRFSNNMPSACGSGGWSPPPVGGAGVCADRVWIDAVALPANSPPTNPPRLANISTRGQVLTGGDVMIAGFIIGGSAAKTVVMTVAGPSLIPAGIPNALANPQLTLIRQSDGVVIGTNDNWQTQTVPGHVSSIQAAGFAPAHPNEPALIATLAPGAYTAIVQGVGGTGVGLVGVYEVNTPEVPMINISTRGQVLTGGDVMIAGFIIYGDNTKSVVVTVAGPSLVAAGIPNALMNPQITIVRQSDGVVIANNDNWQTQTNPAHVAQIQAAGFAPAHPNEPAVILTLPPGAYTAIVQGVGGTGVGLVGVYAIP
ncbi:Calx-beta domain-containing protein [Usitatibacter palustris]|uniref:Calx-beta domain-containing protein n=1 Tax=Usitatibacter palustris TaxID=2732487 RepID=A0A6M4HAE0_9PROT|nr:M12 family metallo-peptidase [Usitatibacter palustris]QJR16521.1 hypothetical protein DSM104440_03356 [Usitatibacter palustris]